MKKYTVDMVINTSHEIDGIGFNCGNRYQIVDDDTMHTKYNSSIFFSDNTPEEYINLEFEKEAQIASLALSHNERNPESGCPFLTIEWESLKIDSSANVADSNNVQEMFFVDQVNIRDSFAMKIKRTIQLSEIKELIKYKQNYSFDIEMFYYGLMSNNARSKFFNFFTIIEGLEGSEAYRKKMNNDFLFSEEEKDKIKSCLEHYEERKKNRLFEILDTATRLSRAEKLYQYLQILNLDCINTGMIGIDDITKIINQRNKLFHSSKKFNSGLLYEKLFPLVREIVIKQLMNENLKSSNAKKPSSKFG